LRVRFTLPARADLEAIYSYISKTDPVAASTIVARLIDRAEDLGATPFEGREVDEPNARVIIVPRLRYFIFYAVADAEVQITHIRHTSRRRL
jgi:toxin ParE1/3/4